MKITMHMNDAVSLKLVALDLCTIFIKKIHNLRTGFLRAVDAWLNFKIGNNFLDDDIDSMFLEKDGWRQNINRHNNMPAHVNPRAWRRHSALLTSWKEQKQNSNL